MLPNRFAQHEELETATRKPFLHRDTPISFLQKCVISITGSLTPSSISFAQRTLAYLRNKEGGNANEERTLGLYEGNIAAI